MEQRRRVQRLITNTGYNPRRGVSSRRARIVPLSSESISQVMSTVQPMIVEEEDIPKTNIQDIVESVEQLSIREDLDTLFEVDDEDGMDTIMDDTIQELDDKRNRIRDELSRLTRSELQDFYRKFFRGISDMTLGHLVYIYSIYLQLDDSRLSTFIADMRELFETDIRTLSIYGPDIVLIDPSIGKIAGIDTLIISDTNVEELPVEIANMQDINTVILTRNDRLRHIPNEVQPLVVYQD